MNLKVPPGAQPPEFQIKRGGEQLTPLPEKNKTPLPSPPQELRPLDLDKTRPLPGKVLPQPQVHLCSYIPETEQGRGLPPKAHACAYIPEQGADLPPKAHACAYIPENEWPAEETPQPKKRKQPLDLGELPRKPGVPQIYQCTARIEPGKTQGPNIYQCTARIEPGKAQSPNIYQCVARLED